MSRKLLICSVALNVGSGILLLILHIVHQPAISLSLVKVGIIVGSACTLAAWICPRLLGVDRADAFFTKFLLLGVTTLISLILA